MRAIVVGGGIGGMTAALSLIKHGIDVEIYEQATAMTEIGAGLQISASATKILKGLGLSEPLTRVGVAAEQLAMNDLQSDRRLYRVPLGAVGVERYGEPFYQVHRPDLLSMLVDALPDGVVHLKERAVRYEQDDHGVSVQFESGHEARGDVLVGADGIHSAVRAQMLGEQEPEFSQIVAWRALIPAEKAASLDLATECHVWLGAKRSAVVYYVHGKKVLNFVGMVPSVEAQAESWTATGEVGALRRSFEGCTERLRQIVELIEQPFITGYYFRYPLSKWSDGRVTILGDAAHPMHPFLAQGACQAMEDAAVLAGVLAKHGEGAVPVGLTEYERLRFDRASRVQNQARTHEHLWHMSDPREITQRNKVLASTMDLDPFAETVWGWLFRYDADERAAVGPEEPWRVMQRPESQRAWKMWATMLKPQDLDRQQHGLRDAYDRFLLQNFPAENAAKTRRGDANGLPYVEVTAGDQSQGPVVLHMHGGGYMIGSAEASVGLVSRIVVAARGRCIAIGYRKAPEHPYPAALEDGVAAYEWLLEQGIDASRIVVSGESAGGGLAVAVAMRLRDRGLPRPAGVIALCPMADFAVTGASVDATAGKDPICTRTLLTQFAANYLQTHDPRDPYISPIYGMFGGLPPLLVQVATNEALFSDAERMVAAARRDQVDVNFDVYDDSVHVFPIFTFLPESRRALQTIGDFVTKHVSS